MIENVYAVRDIKNHFHPPVISDNNDTAKRDFLYSVTSNENIISKFPSDFELFKIANYDNVTGIIESISPIEFICSAMEAFN